MVNCDTTGIERLRLLSVPSADTLSVEQCLTLVLVLHDLAWYTPDMVATTCGLSVEDTLDVIRDLGTWLGQAFGSDGEVEIVTAVKHPFAGTDSDGQCLLLPAHGNGVVMVPAGFERQATRRELDRAIANIVALSVPVEQARSAGSRSRAARSALAAALEEREAVVHRWLLRRNHTVRQVLTYTLLTGVHRVAQLGRLGEIEDLVYGRNGWCNAELARVIVEAFDLLDVARTDALDALDAIVDAAQRGIDVTDTGALERLGAAIAKARWLAEGDMRRLDRCLEQSRKAGEDVGLGRMLTLVARQSRTDAQLRPASIAELSDGQVQRIAESAGLGTEPTSYTEENQVRAWIAEAGLDADADLLFPDGLRVVSVGLGDEFQAALARRATGDFGWADELNAALASRAAA